MMNRSGEGQTPQCDQGPTGAVIGFHRDEERHWVADLDCGHTRHFRHNPPWTNHPWVTTIKGRAAHMGMAVPCVTCAGGDPPEIAPDLAR